VFLGGSLVNVGGHNPMEPAVFSCVVVHGPYIGNNASVYKTLNLQQDTTIQVELHVEFFVDLV
jgi:3-deoxy-D-manno-octulosonic-acid transferase